MVIKKTIHKIVKILNKQIVLTPIQLALVMSVYFVLITNIALFIKVIQLYNDTTISKIIFLFTLVSILVLFYSFVFSIFCIKYISKMIFSILLLFNSSAFYFVLNYGIFIDKYMVINVFHTNTKETIELVNISSLIYILVFGIIPTIVLLRSKINYENNYKSVIKRYLITVLLLFCSLGILGLNYKNISSFFRDNNQLRFIVLPYSIIESSINAARLTLKVKDRKVIDVVSDAKTNLVDDTIFVFIVGETAREANFSLNGYAINNTTEPLDKYNNTNNMIIFNNTSSCGTATAVSVPCMFSDLTRKNFDIQEASYRTNLVDAIAKAGFDVAWFNNNGGHKGVADRIKYINSYKNGSLDKVLLTSLDAYIKSNIKHKNKAKFIVLHINGSHGPTYYMRYPKSAKKFNPTCDTSELRKCSSEEIINAYDNTIYYTSEIITKTIDYANNNFKNVAVLYVSDHGESLGENGLYLHGMPYFIAPNYQTKVPFLIWINDNYKKTFLGGGHCINNISKEDYSHDNIFSTVLGMLNIKTNLYKKELDIFNSCYK